jgi:hypothetical protein
MRACARDRDAIVSTVGEAAPAAHSCASAPDGALVLAEVIASRSVQVPSFAAASPVELTVIVVADEGVAPIIRSATTAPASAIAERLPRTSRHP